MILHGHEFEIRHRKFLHSLQDADLDLCALYIHTHTHTHTHTYTHTHTRNTQVVVISSLRNSIQCGISLKSTASPASMTSSLDFVDLSRRWRRATRPLWNSSGTTWTPSSRATTPSLISCALERFQDMSCMMAIYSYDWPIRGPHLVYESIAIRWKNSRLQVYIQCTMFQLYPSNVL